MSVSLYAWPCLSVCLFLTLIVCISSLSIYSSLSFSLGKVAVIKDHTVFCCVYLILKDSSSFYAFKVFTTFLSKMKTGEKETLISPFPAFRFLRWPGTMWHCDLNLRPIFASDEAAQKYCEFQRFLFEPALQILWKYGMVLDYKKYFVIKYKSCFWVNHSLIWVYWKRFFTRMLFSACGVKLGQFLLDQTYFVYFHMFYVKMNSQWISLLQFHENDFRKTIRHRIFRVGKNSILLS